MSDQFYTKEELELFGGSASDDDPFQPSQSAPGIDSVEHAPVIQYQQPTENVPQFVRDMNDPSGSTYRKVNMGVSIYRSVVTIIGGLIFVLIPLFMLSTMLAAFKASGESGMVTAIPILMVSLFVLVGAGTVVKGVISLISAIRNK